MLKRKIHMKVSKKSGNRNSRIVVFHGELFSGLDKLGRVDCLSINIQSYNIYAGGKGAIWHI